MPEYPRIIPASDIPAPFRRPALLRICELEMWPKIMASTAAGKMKNSNPQTRLAMAKPLVSCAAGSLHRGLRHRGCDGI